MVSVRFSYVKEIQPWYFILLWFIIKISSNSIYYIHDYKLFLSPEYKLPKSLGILFSSADFFSPQPPFFGEGIEYIGLHSVL